MCSTLAKTSQRARAPDGDSADMPRLAGPQGQSALVSTTARWRRWRPRACGCGGWSSPARQLARHGWKKNGGGLVELGRGT